MKMVDVHKFPFRAVAPYRKLSGLFGLKNGCAYRVCDRMRDRSRAPAMAISRQNEPFCLAVTGSRLVDTLDHAWGFPCCIDLPLVCMLSPLPRWNRKVHLSLSSFAISAFPEIMAGRLPHHVLPSRGDRFML
jgi:hypothetical protein